MLKLKSEPIEQKVESELVSEVHELFEAFKDSEDEFVSFQKNSHRNWF